MPDPWDSNDGQTQHLDENGLMVGVGDSVRVETTVDPDGYVLSQRVSKVSDETRGVPLHLVTGGGYRAWVDGGDPDPNDAEPTHTAYPVAEARLLEAAVDALRAISSPVRSSMRYRDDNCVRYIAGDALDALDVHRSAS